MQLWQQYKDTVMAEQLSVSVLLKNHPHQVFIGTVFFHQPLPLQGEGRWKRRERGERRRERERKKGERREPRSQGGSVRSVEGGGAVT